MKTVHRDEILAECAAWGIGRVRDHVDVNKEDPDRLVRLEWLDEQARAVPSWPLSVSAESRRAMEIAWQSGMPYLASAIYARWWQLETWLRTLAYVELRSAFGQHWREKLPPLSEERQAGEKTYRHMTTVDNNAVLSYADAGALFRLIEEHWPLFEPALIRKGIWSGRVEELRAIRNRIGHCRRPHEDDLARIEQTLRDLNGGAFLATSSFNDQRPADEQWNDTLSDGWVRMNHKTARRLVGHAEKQYRTSFELRWSRRPWADPLVAGESIDATPGYLWHATWYCTGGQAFDIKRLWRDLSHSTDVIMLLCADSPASIQLSFSSLESSQTVSDVIGYAFDAALHSLRSGRREEDWNDWMQRYSALDPQVHVMTPWSSVEREMLGISLFRA